MKRVSLYFACILAVLGVAAGCAFITVNITFQQAKEKIEQDAEKITKYVMEGALLDGGDDKDGYENVSELRQGVDIKKKNPTIRGWGFLSIHPNN